MVEFEVVLPPLVRLLRVLLLLLPLTVAALTTLALGSDGKLTFLAMAPRRLLALASQALAASISSSKEPM